MLSLVVITKNEADRIEACLRSVPFATERLVLDCGSTDGTPEVAERAGARVVRTDWPGHVAQKNRGLDLAAGPWVLSLDADERLSADAGRELEAALAAPGDAVGFSFPRLSTWLGRPIRHGKWYPDRKLRCVLRGRARWSGDDPHDRLVAEGPVKPLRGDILHAPYRDLGEHLDTIARYARISARSMAERGVRARRRDVVLRPPLHFVDAYLLRRGFLDGTPGFALASLGASHVLAKWLLLWSEQREGA